MEEEEKGKEGRGEGEGEKGRVCIQVPRGDRRP